MNDLSDAVRALTEPQKSRVMQSTDAGISCVSEVEQDPLLVQLEAAVTSAIGRGGGGGGAGNILNGEALYRVALIRSELETWLLMAKVPRKHGRTLSQKLIDWYDVFTQSGEDTGFRARQLYTWQTTIIELLDPPKRMEITAPCPICGKAKWTDAEGHEIPFPVIVESHPAGGSRGLCRACDFVWSGVIELRRLAWSVQDAG